MTNRQRAETKERCKELFEFLDSYDARLLQSCEPKDAASNAAEFRMYLAVGHIFIATVGPHGWDVFVQAHAGISTSDTLEALCRILGPRPGDAHLEVAR